MAEPTQTVQADGEVLGQTPITATILPGAVRIIVPHDAQLHNAPTADEQPPQA